jgi:hypothetical protein
MGAKFARAWSDFLPRAADLWALSNTTRAFEPEWNRHCVSFRCAHS